MNVPGALPSDVRDVVVDDRDCEFPDLVHDLGQAWSSHCARCNSLHPLGGAAASLLTQARDEIVRLRRLLAEVDRLTHRDASWAASVTWYSEWTSRAVGLLGELRDDLEHELTESGHMEALEQLLADEFDDGEDDDVPAPNHTDGDPT